MKYLLSLRTSQSLMYKLIGTYDTFDEACEQGVREASYIIDETARIEIKIERAKK